MDSELADFLRYCEIERRLAPLTCKAYAHDVCAAGSAGGQRQVGGGWSAPAGHTENATPMNTPPHPPAAPRIELLYFDGCPGAEQILPDLRRLAETTGATLDLHAVETVEHARAVRFLGSPTIRVNGHDVEPGAEQRTDFGIKCRLYSNTASQAHVPPRKWIDTALVRASTG